MRRRNLIMTSALVLCAATAVFFCGCGNGSKAETASAAATDTVINVDESAETPTTQGEAVNTAESAGDDTTAATVATKKTKVKYDKEAPWESFDMYGLPDKLDLLKKDNGDVLVLVNKLHAVSKYFKICSAYRTYDTQKWLYKNYLNTMGKELRDIRSAAPGRSEHHTGYAIDLVTKSTGWTLTQDFAKTDEGKWIKKNCAKYGYIIRYPKGKTDITGYDYEPWHLRYVGVDAAKEITEQNITLEEYLKR